MFFRCAKTKVYNKKKSMHKKKGDKLKNIKNMFFSVKVEFKTFN